MMKVLPPLTLSFEFFPPKTSDGMGQLHDAAMRLTQCNPHFFSVTYGAGGSTREGTLETLKLLKQHTDVVVAPHLSCIGSTREELLEILYTYRALGVKRIVALRGDMPSGMGQTGEFHYANELVAFIRETMGDYFHIEVAAYPEFHPQAPSATEDIINLKRKYLAGADSAITQYFFNEDAYFYLLEECVKQGINMPIVPGIMPITQFARLARFSDACGAEIPRWLRKRLESYGEDVESIKAFGLEFVSNLCQKLIQGGAPGLHFYTLNKAEAVVNIINTLDFSAAKQHENVVVTNENTILAG